mmetsp:Transcript_28422/g.28730  ORF Transcript_28422/g.28730 Transcript_28422/m.28730 type:complete len:157 (-) Transcript_28422:114-584(-)|eukprot:CAMPEP_0182418440 /NCGR_PEP_ID=MMETSP1167-20130531/2874_1 /TAXON_ID=2988 /ORGANISM="Mallomonas Sp, Strain CCMP3275" /LENGTH=156 /DNA_ID=CAMNT_0024592651 /DNA_START=304 /DNA_END=774 /DNA_ORIENTATION=+
MPESNTGSDPDSEVENNDSESIEEVDGFASVISKILHQDTGNKIPVLAKRKTAIMKEIESEKDEKKQFKRQRMERKEERDKHLVIPDHTTGDYERQLRRLATRGVIALFNAISKAKHETVLDSDTKEKKKTNKADTKPAPNVSSLTQGSVSKIISS